LLHWILSVIPPEIVAQAVSVAVRVASFSEVPDAVAQFVRPLYVMQTSHVNWRSPIVKKTNRPITPSTNTIANHAVFDIELLF